MRIRRRKLRSQRVRFRCRALRRRAIGDGGDDDERRPIRKFDARDCFLLLADVGGLRAISNLLLTANTQAAATMSDIFRFSPPPQV